MIEMLQFESTNLQDLEREFEERSHEISLAVVEGICDALDNGEDYIEIGEFPKLISVRTIATELDLALFCYRDDFLESLQVNLPRCIESEDYELCIRARDWIKKLKDD